MIHFYALKEVFSLKGLQTVIRGLQMLMNTLASGWFWRFSQKKQQFSAALPTP